MQWQERQILSSMKLDIINRAGIQGEVRLELEVG